MLEAEKKSVLDTALEMVAGGLVVGTMGNVSMRVHEPGNGEDLVAITPSGCYYDSLTVDDIVIVDFNGGCIEGDKRPSIETMLHIGIYKARRSVHAIVHSHPVFSGVVSMTCLEIPPLLDEQVACLGGEIAVADYALPGSRELIRNVIEALGRRNAVILANHGALTVGPDLKEALTNTEMMEKIARMYVYALGTGTIKLLPEEAVKIEQSIFDAHCNE
jgi:L-fuculose-phosphate aldolase